MNFWTTKWKNNKLPSRIKPLKVCERISSLSLNLVWSAPLCAGALMGEFKRQCVELRGNTSSAPFNEAGPCVSLWGVSTSNWESQTVASQDGLVILMSDSFYKSLLTFSLFFLCFLELTFNSASIPDSLPFMYIEIYIIWVLTGSSRLIIGKQHRLERSRSWLRRRCCSWTRRDFTFGLFSVVTFRF